MRSFNKAQRTMLYTQLGGLPTLGQYRLAKIGAHSIPIKPSAKRNDSRRIQPGTFRLLRLLTSSLYPLVESSKPKTTEQQQLRNVEHTPPKAERNRSHPFAFAYDLSFSICLCEALMDLFMGAAVSGIMLEV